MGSGKSVRQDRPLTRWTLWLVVATSVVAIGLPLIGVRVFHASDILFGFAPWRSAAPDGFEPANPLVTDTVNAVVPMRAEYRRQVLDGEYPLWSSYPSGGVPLGSTPDYGTLSPLNLPYLLFPPWYAPAAAKLLEMIVAIGFAFLFLRRVGLGRPASLVGGLVFAFSGFQVAWTNWPQSHVGALIPALFWAVERAVQSRRLRSAQPVAVVVAVMLFEGFPAVVGYSLLAAGAYAIVRAATIEEKLRRRIGILASLGAAVALGVGIAAIQLLPFAERLSQLDLAYREQLTGHLPLHALATLAVPNTFGSVDHYFASRNYVETVSFIGAAALVLIGAGLVWRPNVRTGVRPFLYCSAAFVAMLIYVGGPVLVALQSFPLFSQNFVGRMRSVLGFLLAALAALGLQAAMGQNEPPDGSRRRRFHLLAVPMLLAFAAYVTWQAWQVVDEAGQMRYALRQAIVPGVAGTAALVAVVAGRRVRIAGRGALAWAIPALIAAECLAFALPFWPRIPRSQFYPATSTHAFLAENLGHDRIASNHLTMFPGATTFFGIRSLTAKAFTESSWKELLTAASPDAFASPTWPTLPATPDVMTSPILDRLGVRYFVVDPRASVVGRRLPRSPGGGSIRLAAGKTVTFPVPRGTVRAVLVGLAGRYRGTSERAWLRVELVDAHGGVLVTGGRRLEPTDRAGDFHIPVPETSRSLPQGTRARLSLDAGNGAVPLESERDVPSASVVLARDDGLRLAFVDGAVVYERLRALPRIRWASSVETIGHPAARIAALEAGPPADTVILDEPGPPGSGRPAILSIRADDGDDIRVRVDAGGEGYVVVADAMRHGWRASVDGEAAELRPADHAVVALRVPAGSHEIALRYEPSGWRAGRLVSLAAGVIVLSILVGPLLHRRAR